MENFGKTRGLEKASFSWVDLRLITAPEFISEPVAGSVSTVP